MEKVSKINKEATYYKTYTNSRNFKGLSKVEKDLLMIIVSYQERFDTVFLSNNHILEDNYDNEISATTLGRRLKRLEELGLISRVNVDNQRVIAINQLTYDIINGVVVPQEDLKPIEEVLVSIKKEVSSNTIKNNVKISASTTTKTNKVMKRIQTKGERDFEIELNNLEKTIQEQIIPINLDEPISITDLRPTPTTTITKEEVKVKMYDKDEPITTKEAIKLLFPVPDKRSEYLAETIESFNGFKLEGKDFQLTPDTLTRILNGCYPELTERVQNRTI